MTPVFEADIIPVTPAILTAPHAAKSFAYISAHGILTFTHIEDRFIGRRYRYRTNGAAKVFVGNVFPVAPCIRRFPDTTTSSSKEEICSVFITTRHRAASPTAEGTDQPVLAAFDQLFFMIDYRYWGSCFFLLGDRHGKRKKGKGQYPIFHKQ